MLIMAVLQALPDPPPDTRVSPGPSGGATGGGWTKRQVGGESRRLVNETPPPFVKEAQP